MIGPKPVCSSCKHFDKYKVQFVCEAFPDRIPDSILIHGDNHSSPIEGDHGIQFESGKPSYLLLRDANQT